MQGTNTIRGTTQILHPEMKLSFTHNARHTAQTTFYAPNTSYASGFFQAATVGNSSFHLNLRKLSAGDFLSLKENETLLYTINAFHYLTNSIS